ncbi:MAG: serine hydroxymethyltransferase, partial [Gammaproteobacteria bacterium]
VGTPAITTRGFREAESVELTHWICDILAGLESGAVEPVIAGTRAKVQAICDRFPVYG